MDWILFVLLVLASYTIFFVLACVGIDLFCYLLGSRPQANSRSDIRRQIRHTGRHARRAVDQASEEYLSYLQQQLRR